MRTIAALLLLASPLAALAAGRGAPSAHVDDLVTGRTVTLPAPTTPVERKPVSFAWALDPFSELGASAPFMAESREYWTQVDAAELVRGFELDASAPGPVVRISPIASAAAVSSDKLSLSRDGRRIAGATAFAHSASAEQLQKLGMDLGNGSAVVQLDPALGKGRFKLQMSAASGRYLVHVFEPNSPYLLQAQAMQANLLADGQLEVTAKLGKDALALPASELGGLLVSPSGKSIELKFARSGNGARSAFVRIPANAGAEPGLWEVQVFAGAVVDGARVQRDARTAISVAQPTARLAGRYRFDPARLDFAATLQVGSPGRYELRATLYATGPEGVARPVSVAHSAAWFDKGPASLQLRFDRANVPLGYGAPYEVRYLELKDQSRMGQLETRAVALSSNGR